MSSSICLIPLINLLDSIKTICNSSSPSRSLTQRALLSCILPLFHFFIVVPLLIDLFLLRLEPSPPSPSSMANFSSYLPLASPLQLICDTLASCVGAHPESPLCTLFLNAPILPTQVVASICIGRLQLWRQTDSDRLRRGNQTHTWDREAGPIHKMTLQ